MNATIERLATQILEEGFDDDVAAELVGLLAHARAQQLDGKATEDNIKALWLDAYFRGQVEKTVTADGVKVQCRDASAPKETRVEGHYEIDTDALLTNYDPAVLVEMGIAKWVPPRTEMKGGSKATVAVYFPK